MLLPNCHLASVDRRKIVEYLLSRSHPRGRAKAAFFMRFGFSVEEWQLLASELLRIGRSNPVARVIPSLYGVRYTVEGQLYCPDGRSARVRTVWFVELHERAPRLVTTYPC